MQPNTVKCRELIVSNIAIRGDGVIHPLRAITQVFDKSGNLIAENDPLPDDRYNYEDMLDLMDWCLHRINDYSKEIGKEDFLNTYFITRKNRYHAENDLK